jgi:hypothetical protein
MAPNEVVSALSVAGALSVGTTLGVSGITTLAGLLNANAGIAVDTNKFTVRIDDPSFEQTNIPGEDRVIKTTIPVRVKAYILNPNGPSASALNKLISVNKIVSMTETDMSADEYALNNRSNPPGFQQDLTNR